MTEDHSFTNGDVEPVASLPEGETLFPPEAGAAEAADEESQRRILIGLAIGGVVLLVLLIVGIILLLQPGTDTAKIRDVFIIVMALESLVIGASLIVVMLQLARLINLLQNEIQPILESTQKTANTLRGTTIFLSDHLAEPVVKLNEYLAALRPLMEALGLRRRK